MVVSCGDAVVGDAVELWWRCGVVVMRENYRLEVMELRYCDKTVVELW